MNTNITNAQQDLAFMKSIVDEVAPNYRNAGIVYMWAGILYGLQCVVNYLLLVWWPTASSPVWLTVSIAPTVIFLIINFTYVWKNRQTPFGSGAARKAVNAVFAGVGISNAILAIIFGFVAYQKADWSIWFLFPIVVCAGQGAVWFTINIVRRELWIAVTSIGWFVATAVLAMVINNVNLYLLALGVTLIGCMAVPGYLMTRSQGASVE